MKIQTTISKLILFLAVFAFASCTQKPKYQLEGLTNPLLDEWFDCFKAADSSFSAENFEATYFSEEDMEDISEYWYDSPPAYAKEYIFRRTTIIISTWISTPVWNAVIRKPVHCVCFSMICVPVYM